MMKTSSYLLLLIELVGWRLTSGFVFPITLVGTRDTISSSSRLYGTGFSRVVKSNDDKGIKKKPWDTDPLPSTGTPPHSAQLCTCGSGKTYHDCCERLHNVVQSPHKDVGTNAIHTVHAAASSSLSSFRAEEMLRARYTAYKHGLSDFIIATTHPLNEDYVKFVEELPATRKTGYQRWTKEIIQMSEQFDYLGMEVVAVDEDPSKVIASVIFRALFRQEDGAYMAIEENALFRRFTGTVKEGFKGRIKYSDGPNPISTPPTVQSFDLLDTTLSSSSSTSTTNSQRWLFFDSETDDPEPSTAQDMVETWPTRPENTLSRWGNSVNGKSTGGKSLVIGGKGENNNRPQTRLTSGSSGGLSANTPLQALGKGRA